MFANNNELVDTHTHLNDEKFLGKEADTIARAQEVGVTRLINFGDTMASSKRAAELAETFAGVYAGVGIHPEEAYAMTVADDERLAKWTQQERVVAIGEIGLDYYWEKDNEKRDLQKSIFIRQLALARDLHLPVCIHSREAHGDTLSILKKEAKGLEGVLHCFSGSEEMAKEVVRLGFYLGVDGPLTYKNARQLPSIVKSLPLERFLLETDAPYLAPVPMRGKMNEPMYLPYIAAKVARIKGVSAEEVASVTTASAIELYSLQ